MTSYALCYRGAVNDVIDTFRPLAFVQREYPTFDVRPLDETPREWVDAFGDREHAAIEALRAKVPAVTPYGSEITYDDFRRKVRRVREAAADGMSAARHMLAALTGQRDTERETLEAVVLAILSAYGDPEPGPAVHRPSYGRTRLGRATYGRGGGYFYGTTVECSCREFRKQINEAPSKGGQKWAEELFAAHVAESAAGADTLG